MALPTDDPLAAAAADPMAISMEEPTEEAGYTILIHVSPDGTFSVGKQGEEDAMQPADTVKDALTMALEIVRADGRKSAEDQFSAGFSGKEIA